MRKHLAAGVLLGALSLAGCDLTRLNPNAPTEERILGSREGIVNVAIGLQRRYADAIDDFVASGGLVTDEFGAPSATFISYRDAEVGILADDGDPVELPWGNHFRTIKSANDLLVHAPNVELGEGTEAGILSLANLFKAMAIGNLIQLYEQIPLDVYENASAPFVSRDVALAEVLDLLDEALIQFDRGVSNEFTTTILATGIDLRNTILAMQARYQRLAGDHAAAASAAAAVSPSVLSVLTYDLQVVNPIWNRGFSSSQFRPTDAFSTEAEATDDRASFTATATPFHVIQTADVSDFQPLNNFRQYNAEARPIALYYPGEMVLIRAEALVRQATPDLATAATLVNSVRTKCDAAPTGDPEACEAALPATALDTPAELLAEIYRQRRFELYATGLRWEDLRRLGEIGTGLPGNRCWLIYPRSERNSNPNVPPENPEPSAPPATNARCADLELPTS
jgi:starch-binding outer membrane protein, SusD/RagB family